MTTAGFELAEFDVVVVGAGPAGLAASAAAAEAGLRVAVVDNNAQVGGQYWRHASGAAGHSTIGWHDDRPYQRLRRRFDSAGSAGQIDYLPNSQVWFIEAPEAAGQPYGLRLTGFSDVGPQPPRRTVRAAKLILCPGGYDRQLPIPGWDLPGVMAAGGAQAMLKGFGVLAGRRAIVAGTGPFLLPVATGLAEAGAKVVGVCEANSLGGWLPNLRGAAQVPSKGRDLVGYTVALARHRIPFWTRTAITAINGGDRGATRVGDPGAVTAGIVGAAGVSGDFAHPSVTSRTVERERSDSMVSEVAAGGRNAGDAAEVFNVTGSPDQVRSVTISKLDRTGQAVGSSRELEVDLVALGWGFTPSLELLTAVGAATRVDVDGSLVVVVDREQRTSAAGVYAAGEVTGVGGAALAVLEGELAGRAAAHGTARAYLAAADIRQLQRKIARARAFATAMHRAHPIPERWANWLTDDTTICRCEEVSYADVCHARDDLGAGDPRTIKMLSRTGMGWCQGRVCGFAADLLSRSGEESETGSSFSAESAAESLRPIAKRPFCAPIALAALASATAERSSSGNDE